MSDIDIHHLAAASALDALDSHAAAFEAHYPSCEVCRADVLEFRSTLAVVAEAEAVHRRPISSVVSWKRSHRRGRSDRTCRRA